MNALLVAVIVVLGLGLPLLWLWWTGRRIKQEYRQRWDDLNSRMGGILPDYDEATRRRK